MPDINQLVSALKKADEAGDSQAAQAISAAIKQQRDAVSTELPTQARRPFAGGESYEEAGPIGRQAMNVLGQGARAMGQAVGGVAGIFVDPLIMAKNKLFGTNDPGARDAMSQVADMAGLPKAETGPEKAAEFATEFITGMPLGGMFTRSITPASPPRVPVSRAPNPGAATLETAGVPLDASQRSGSALSSRVRSAVTDHPITAERQARFTTDQLRAYTRAVLRTIGETADEANQAVMGRAKARIGGVFNSVAKKSPAVYDDALETDIAGIVQHASRILPDTELRVLQTNVDDILSAVDETGRINGEAFNRITSTLGGLSKRKDVGRFARDIQESLFSSLERASPDDLQALRSARQQWRSMNIIDDAIGKGVEKFISPLRLSNAVATKANQNMSVYGQGGDQSLVRLAEAGRQVLPESLPNSGTAPRGWLQSPLRAVGTGPIYRGAQSLLHRQSSDLIPTRTPPISPESLAIPSALAAQQSMTPEEQRRKMLAEQMQRMN